MRVNTDSIVFTRCGHSSTLVNVFITVLSFKTRRTGACPLSSHLVGVAPGSWFAGVNVALVIQVANETSFAKRTLALVFADLVHTSSSRKTRIDSTVVLILLAVWSDETIDTDALVASLGVSAGAMVLTGIVEGTLVHILQTISSSVVWRTLTGVGVDSVNTDATILTNIAFTIVNVYLTVGSGES